MRLIGYLASLIFLLIFIGDVKPSIGDEIYNHSFVAKAVENVAPAVEATKEEAPKAEAAPVAEAPKAEAAPKEEAAPAAEAPKEEQKSESSTEKK